MKAKLFIIVNEDRFFLSHRLPIALAAKQDGFDVTIVARNTGKSNDILAYGLKYIDLPINPTGMNPIQEIKCLIFLMKLYKKHRPDIVHHVGLKNILWGGVVAKLCKINGVVNAVSGLGSLFNNGEHNIISRAVLSVIRFNNQRDNVKVIFQNEDDIAIFLNNSAVQASQIEFSKGSGIDLDEYKYVPEPNSEKIKVIFTGRMVKEKGICDLIEAAEILKPSYHQRVSFILCGRLTPNKSSINENYFKEHCDGDYISWLGERSDVKTLLENSHIMAFPSYYREGLPKSLIEACAIGRPIITCNSIGCKDVVDDRINGLLIPIKNPQKLSESLSTLINNREMRISMGKAARQKAELEFSIKDVISKHLSVYKELCNK